MVNDVPRTRHDLDRLYPLVLGEIRRHFEIHVLDRATRGDVEVFLHREHRVRRPDLPTIWEAWLRRHAGWIAQRRTIGDPTQNRALVRIGQAPLVPERSSPARRRATAASCPR